MNRIAGSTPCRARSSAQAVVLTGAAGSGKTTVATLLAERLGWAFSEGDDHHSAENVAKMRAGIPLTDSDRAPWLNSIATWIASLSDRNENVIVSCSALRRVYRDILRRRVPDVRFVQLIVCEDALVARVAARDDHYMPPTLVRSQVELLEPLTDEEQGVVIDAHKDPAAITDEIVRWLQGAVERPRSTND